MRSALSLYLQLYNYVKIEIKKEICVIMNIKDKKESVIVCPVCGYEYLPAEIFIPKVFFGYPEDIERTVGGKIDVYEGTPMDLTEKYTCDHCGAKFNVTADIKFKTKEEVTETFSTIYSSPLTQKISLSEEIGENL